MPITDHALIARAANLIPLLAEHAAETERGGRLAPASAAALREAGLLNLFAPAKQTDLATAFDVYEQLAIGDGSSAWVAMLAGGASYLTGLLGDQARKDVWGTDPDAMVCGGIGQTGSARPASGGFLVTGRWRPLSGIYQAQWAQVGLPAGMLALVPVADGEIVPTWSMTGMQGTGSHTLAVEDVFVPEHRMLSLPRALAGGYAEDHPDEPFYSATPLSFLIVALLAPLLGMAKAAFQLTLDRGAGEVLTVADAAIQLDTARLHADRAMADVTVAQSQRVPLTVAERARVRGHCAAAVDAIRTGTRLLLGLNGTSGFAADQPIQRIWRDIEVASSHQLLNTRTAREIAGRQLLGLEQTTPTL
jgi:alkylation response protein AidB-like acyl-CoA dehydrogenase